SGSRDRVDRGLTANHATRQSSSHVLDHCRDADPGDGGDGVKRQSAACAELLERATPMLRARQADLICRGELLPPRQVRRVRQQLVVDRVIVRHGIAGIVGIEVDQVDQDAGPLDVAQETVAQSLPFRRTRDQTRYVRNHEAPALVEPNDPERGSKSPEGIVGDLGFGRRHTRHERGLADIRYANDAHVGEELELEAYPALLAGASEVSASRSAIRRAREASVASSAASAGGRSQALPRRRQIPEKISRVAPGHHGPERNAEDRVAAAPPVLVGAFAVLTSLGVVVALVVKVEERGDRGISLEEDATTVAPV